MIRIIVLDGMDWLWTDAHREATAPLYERAACWGPLHAADPPITPTGVAALLCGRNVELPWAYADHYATARDLIRTRPWLYDIVHHGLTWGLCNVPLTWPWPRTGVPRGCWLTSGFPMDRAALTDPGMIWFSPAGLDVAGYPVEAVVADHGDGGRRDAVAYAREERRIVEWALRAPRTDVQVVWLVATDRAGHHSWGSADYAETCRVAVESAIRAADGADTVLVISDHGFDALTSDRCAAYRATTHGPTAARAGLVGGHAEQGVIFAWGAGIAPRGLMPEQRLVEVAGGMYDLLGLPPAPGMVSAGPLWADPLTDSDAQARRETLKALGYVE